jgi:hypothetical protein
VGEVVEVQKFLYTEFFWTPVIEVTVKFSLKTECLIFRLEDLKYVGR